jgi:predicted PurR-regulated permease PerM
VISEREYMRRMVRTVMTVAGVAVLVFALWAAREALLLIYISALIAMGFSPLVRVLERPAAASGPATRSPLARHSRHLHRHRRRDRARGLMVIPPLVAQAAALWDKLPTEFNRLQMFMVRRKLMTRTITLAEAVQSAPAGSSSNAVETLFVALSSVIGGVFGVITVLILSFYLLIEANAMFEYVVRFVPAGRRADVATAARDAVTKVSAWLRAQFLLAAVMGLFAAVGLGALGVPYFYVVALVAALGETIPIVGPIIGGITAVAVASTVSAKLALGVGAFFLVLHQLEANVLVPKVMEKRVGVSPVGRDGGAADRRGAVGDRRRDPRDTDCGYPVGDRRRPCREPPNQNPTRPIALSGKLKAGSRFSCTRRSRSSSPGRSRAG